MDEIYGICKNIFKCKFLSLDLYHINPKSIDKKHYHDNSELVYIVRGKCQTHQKGRFYVYKRGQRHEVVNDSKNDLVMLCLTVPPESEERTHYL